MRASPIKLLAFATCASAVSVWTTPHASFSSSVGVLGCKINTNRVAYWPMSIDCTNICVKLTYGDRSVNLLRIDHSGGAYDISYDAWNYLQSGVSATVSPMAGGGVAMEYESVDASECADLIYTADSKLPLSAANSIDFLASCLSEPGSWVAQNYVLYNICDAICTLGFDETCSLDMAVSNQPSCPHTLGLQSELSTERVYNIEYPTGQVVDAGSGKLMSPSVLERPGPEVDSPGAPESQQTGPAALAPVQIKPAAPESQPGIPKALESESSSLTATEPEQTSMTTIFPATTSIATAQQPVGLVVEKSSSTDSTPSATNSLTSELLAISGHVTTTFTATSTITSTVTTTLTSSHFSKSSTSVSLSSMTFATVSYSQISTSHYYVNATQQGLAVTTATAVSAFPSRLVSNYPVPVILVVPMSAGHAGSQAPVLALVSCIISFWFLV